MFKFSNSAKTQTLECSRFRCHSTRISQTQSSCPRVTDEDRLLFENTQIKYQLKQLEEEFQIFKLQQRQSRQQNTKQGQKSLDVQNKQLELELLNKMKEIECLKRNMNFTRHEELKIECKEYQRETFRLKKQIYQLNTLLNMKSKGVNFHEVYEDLQQRIRKMHQENKQYTQQISLLQSENVKFKNQIEKLEIDNKHLDRENKRQLQLISQAQLPQEKFKNRLQIYREEVEGAKLQQKITELQQRIVEQQNYKEQYISKLLKIIEEKEDQLKAYEIANPNSIMRQTTKTEQDVLDAKYDDCVQNIQTQHSIVDDFVFEMPSSLNLVRQPSVRKKVHLEYQKSFQIDMTSINNVGEDLQEEYEEESDFELNDEKCVRVPKVNYYDVEKIGKLLKFQFMTKSIPWSFINQIFDAYEGNLKILEVKEILTKEPFLMQDQKEITLISRYLVEDNTQDYVNFSIRQFNTIPIIKSVFRQLLGKYELFTLNEKENCELQLKAFFQKNFKYSSLDECDNQECEAIMKNQQSSLQTRTIEYLQMINFNLQGHVDKYCWKQLLQYFCNIN